MARRTYTRLALLALLVALAVGLGLVGAASYRNRITPEGIIIHHSAIPLPLGNAAADVKLLDEIHRRRGYSVFYWGRVYHVGYHYIILPDGTLQSGRPETCRGAHALGHNSSIGVCLVGDFSAAGNPDGASGLKEPTEAQMRTLVELCRRLQGRYRIPEQRVLRHRDVNPETDCPGERFPFPRLRDGLGQPD